MVAARRLLAGFIAGAILAGCGRLIAAEPPEDDAGQSPEVSIAVRPQVCFEPCDIRASIRISNYEPEREVCLAIYDASAEGPDDPDRRSCWPWYGQMVTDVTIRHIPAGVYNVVASLTAAAGRRATQTLQVTSRHGALQPDGGRFTVGF